MKLTPTWRINSLYHIHPMQLIELGYRAAIIDLDNTLLASHSVQATVEMTDWVTIARQVGLSLYVVSNNRMHRVGRVLTPLAIPFTANALKPRKYGFQKALKYFNIPHHEVIVIGDQLITDLVGAKRMGLDIILVKPLVDKDNIYTVINRSIERLVFKWIGIDRFSDWGNTFERK